MITGKVTGIDEMLAKIRNFKAAFPQVIADAMKTDGDVDVIECKKRSPVYDGPRTPSAPIPGVLQESIHLEGPTIKGEVISTEIVAGGLAGAYAIPQHENLTFKHKIGQAKYIESVIFEGRDKKLARLAALIDISKMKV